MRRWSARLGAGVAALALVTGCGGSSAPSDAVPALGTSLERVDDAIVEGRYDEARSELDELVATTNAAREDGDLERSEADRILAAAAQVKSALPAEPAEPAEEPADEPAEEPAPSEEPTPTESESESEEPSPTPSESTSESSSDDGSDEEEPEDDEQEKLEKEQEKLEEQLQKEKEKDE